MILPLHTNLAEWASSLIIDFPNDDIPILEKDTDWQLWGGFLVQEPSFEQAFAPSPYFYDDWRAWAIDVYYTMANNA